MVGMSLALLLARQGLRAHLVGSIAPPAQADVRAYAINHAARQTLIDAGGWPDDATAVTPVQRMRVFGDTSGALHFDAPPPDALTWIVDGPAVIARLQAAIGAESRISVSAHARAAGLSVICEGRDTASRAQAGLEVISRRYGHDALATRVLAEQAHQGCAWQWFDGQGILGLLPLGASAGRELAVVWSQAPQRSAQAQALSPEDLGQALSKASAHALGRLQVCAPVAVWPLLYSRATRWVAPGLALAGDAAHTVHPLSGHGLNLGLADVAELSAQIARREYWRGVGDWRVLRRYERARAAPTRVMQNTTDALYLLFDSAWPIAAPLRNWGLSLFDRVDAFKRAALRQARHAP